MKIWKVILDGSYYLLDEKNLPAVLDEFRNMQSDDTFEIKLIEITEEEYNKIPYFLGF